MRRAWAAWLLLLDAGASKVFLRSAQEHVHHSIHHSSSHASGHAHNPGVPHFGGGGHGHFGGHGGGAYMHNGVIHRPPAPHHRDAPPAAPAAPAVPHTTGLPHNPYDHSPGQQYVPPSGMPAASPMGGLSGMGGLGGMMGMAGSVLPAVAAGTAISHMAGHHGGPRAAGAVSDWQSLDICNVYPSSTPLTMVHWQGQFKKTGSPLLYKTCRAHDQTLMDGDNFTFQLGNVTVGSFNVSRVANRALMVLVVGGNREHPGRASFVSHVFRGTAPQSAALVDAYVGKGAAPAKVADGQAALDFSQEVALRPGAHMMSLVGANATDKRPNSAQWPMEVPNDSHAKYLLARVGGSGKGNETFPEELLVLALPLKQLASPTLPPKSHRSAAATHARAPALLLLALASASLAAVWR